MVYGYARCSTTDSKQDISRQERELKAAGAAVIISEYDHGDGAKAQLTGLMEILKPGDALIVTEVSRLSRSTRQLCQLIEEVKAKRILLRILGSITIDCRAGKVDPMTAAFLQMAGVFSELELAMIRERVRSGMAAARAKGQPIGRPPLSADQLPAAFLRGYTLYNEGKLSKTDLARMTGCSRPTIYRYIKVMQNI